ncbi:MAG: hypothetical protein BLITH_0844 [Brockia lithotrophica]|uniref:Flagellar hook-length control protein FliK n=1 Tax=Brockia lithotrophica TaxID=933949 RepID=A0A2T5G908_9BACL|nr:MAG: hypothetical protein BLITH_0844 [Brockia lithotrophica]
MADAFPRGSEPAAAVSVLRSFRGAAIGFRVPVFSADGTAYSLLSEEFAFVLTDAVDDFSGLSADLPSEGATTYAGDVHGTEKEEDGVPPEAEGAGVSLLAFADGIAPFPAPSYLLFSADSPAPHLPGRGGDAPDGSSTPVPPPLPPSGGKAESKGGLREDASSPGPLVALEGGMPAKEVSPPLPSTAFSTLPSAVFLALRGERGQMREVAEKVLAFPGEGTSAVASPDADVPSFVGTQKDAAPQPAVASQPGSLERPALAPRPDSAPQPAVTSQPESAGQSLPPPQGVSPEGASRVSVGSSPFPDASPREASPPVSERGLSAADDPPAPGPGQASFSERTDGVSRATPPSRGEGPVLGRGYRDSAHMRAFETASGGEEAAFLPRSVPLEPQPREVLPSSAEGPELLARVVRLATNAFRTGGSEAVLHLSFGPDALFVHVSVREGRVYLSLSGSSEHVVREFLRQAAELEGALRQAGIGFGGFAHVGRIEEEPPRRRGDGRQRPFEEEGDFSVSHAQGGEGSGSFRDAFGATLFSGVLSG